jgi:Putative bacterial sensory transduction regulator
MTALMEEQRVRKQHSTATGWELIRSPGGWLTWRRPFDGDEADILSLHTGWAGLIKLVNNHGKLEQRIEVYPGSNLERLDEEAALDSLSLMEDLQENTWFHNPGDRNPEWQPPAADVMARWLADAGVEPAVDQDKNVRFTHKRRGCDGQVKITRGPGLLRLTLPLGRWQKLEQPVEQAMLHLATLANNRSRLVRIAWLAEEDTRRCEAQVDLTELPEATEPGRERMWRAMLTMAVAGTELALRQLALELPLLAEPGNRELVDSLL